VAEGHHLLVEAMSCSGSEESFPSFADSAGHEPQQSFLPAADMIAKLRDTIGGVRAAATEHGLRADVMQDHDVRV